MIRGVGTDIVSVERFRRAGARWGDRFFTRVFTDAELAYCRARKDPYPHLAARFAAKEAVIKALSALWESPEAMESSASLMSVGSTGVLRGGGGSKDGEDRVRQPKSLTLRDIEILNHKTGRPYIRVDSAGRMPAGLTFHLSMSHDGGMATAMVVLEKTAGQPL